MQETLSVIIIILTCVVAASALVAFLLIFSSSRSDMHKRDRARLLIMLCFLMESILCTVKVAQIINDPTQCFNFYILDLPNIIIILMFQYLFFSYPLEVLKPGFLNLRRSLLLGSPFLIILFCYYIFDFNPIPLETPHDIIENISTPDVTFRLVALGLLVPYSLMLPLMHLNARVINVTTIGLFVYSMTLLFQTLLVIFYMVTGVPYFYIIYLVVAICAIVYIIYYELNIREIFGLEAQESKETVHAPAKAINIEEDQTGTARKIKKEIDRTEVIEPIAEFKNEDTIYENIKYQFEVHQIWKYPNLDINSLAKEIGTNKTYIQKCIKNHTGFSYTEFVNRKRIAEAIKMMEDEPDKDLKKIFLDAGYVSRTTAWRNFKTYTGMTPTEYMKSNIIH